jgi:hypothetical protein
LTKLDASVRGVTNGSYTDGQGVLNAVATVLSNVFIPSLQRLEKGWGSLDENPNASHVKTEFINHLDSFVGVLVGE